MYINLSSIVLSHIILVLYYNETAVKITNCLEIPFYFSLSIYLYINLLATTLLEDSSGT